MRRNGAKMCQNGAKVIQNGAIKNHIKRQNENIKYADFFQMAD